MENNTDQFPTPSLLCLENSNICFGDMWDHKNLNLNNHCLIDNNLESSETIVGFLVLSDETVWCLVEKEKEHLPHHDYFKRLSGGDLELITLRNEAIEWIFKVNAYHGFGPSCFILAVNYLDRYLSVKESAEDGNNGWAVQLLGQACLSIAAKMEESNVPKPEDFQVGESKPPFDASAFRRMELLVLSTLKWKMQSLTPCTFIEYFLRKMTCEEHDDHPSITSVWKSLDLLPNIIKCIEFLEFKPSEIAAATAIFVSGEKQTKVIDDAMNKFGIMDKEKILKCVEVIRDFSLGKISANPGGRKPPSPIGVLDLDVECCFSLENDELINGGSYANSPTENSNAKRHKSSGESFKDGSF